MQRFFKHKLKRSEGTKNKTAPNRLATVNPHTLPTTCIKTPKIVDILLSPTDRDTDLPQKWTYTISLGEHSVSGPFRNPIQQKHEEEIRWLLEDHSTRDPFNISRANTALGIIDKYATLFYQQIKTGLDTLVRDSSTSALSSTASSHILLRVLPCQGNLSAHSLHWEALELLQQCNISVVRVVTPSITQIAEKFNITPASATNTLRILFLTARAADDEYIDVPYRMVARLVQDSMKGLTHVDGVTLDFVRPGTWSGLSAALHSKPPGYYNVVHMDIHGKSSKTKAWLYLNSSEDSSSLHKVKASEFGKLFTERQVGAVVLNACNSANSNYGLESNLTATLIQYGIKHVVGMSYELLVSTASVLIPTFYQQVLYNGMDFLSAVYQTRKRMIQDKARDGILGTKVILPDSIVLVIYQSSEVDIVFLDAQLLGSRPSPKTQPQKEPMIGSDLQILKVETALTIQSHAITLEGDTGIGKTAFLRHAAAWWMETNFVNNLVWIDCENDTTVKNSITLAALSEKVSSEIYSFRNKKSNSQSYYQGLLVIDHSEYHLSDATPEQKLAFKNSLLNQTEFYVIIAVDQRDKASLDLLPCHLFPFQAASAVEFAYQCLSKKEIEIEDTPNRHYLQGITRILRGNPQAIELALKSAPMMNGHAFRAIFEDLQLPSPKSPLIKAVSRTRLMQRTLEIFTELDSAAEKNILLSLSQARVYIKKDPDSFIESLVYSEILSLDPIAVDDTEKKAVVTYLAEMNNYSRGKERQLTRRLITTFLGLSPYRQQFSTVMSKLQTFGLIVDENPDFFTLHPLLPYCLMKLVSKHEKHLSNVISVLFLSNYRMHSSSWPSRYIADQWCQSFDHLRTKQEHQYYKSLDFLNCSTVLRCIIQNDSSTWLSDFPWHLLIHMGVNVCGIFDSPVAAYEKTIMVDLLVDFLHRWNKVGILQQSKTKVHLILEDSGLEARYNGGSEMGALTACWVSMILFRHHSFGHDAIAIVKSWNEVIRLWMTYNQMFMARVLERPNTMDLLGAWCHLRGFTSYLSSPVDSTRYQFLREATALTQKQKDWAKPLQRFKDGVAEREWLSEQYSAFTPLELEEMEIRLINDQELAEDEDAYQQIIVNSTSNPLESATTALNASPRQVYDKLEKVKSLFSDAEEKVTSSQNRKPIFFLATIDQSSIG